MENFMNQMRTKFTGMEENKADHGGTSDQKIIPIQKTQSFKEKKKGQSWLSKIGRRMSRDDESRDMDMEHAAAIAAAAFAIDSKEDTEQKKKSETREAPLTKTKSKVDSTKSPISLLGSASKRLSGSFRSTTDQGNKMTISSATDEKNPEKGITPAPSMRKSSTLTDKKPEFPAPKAPPPPPPSSGRTSTKTGPVRPPTPTRSGIGDRKADEWERTELEMIRGRYEKLKSTIDSWENKRKVNATRKLHKEEGELEKRRMKALENFQTNMKSIDKIASGARTQAEERRRNEEQRTKGKANVIRRTGKLPGICLCF